MAMSGLFSDVEVICKGTLWKLHKSIICSRCSYFEKAFTGHFKEAESKVLNLPDQDPIKVHWIIYFIYTARAKSDLAKLLASENTLFQTCIDALIVADYFGIDQFHHTLVESLRQALMKTARSIQEKHRATAITSSRTNVVSAAFLDGFFSTAKHVYDNECFKDMREVFVKFFVHSRFLLLRTTKCHEKLQSVPKLGPDVLSALYMEGASHKPPRSLIMEGLPSKCQQCGENKDFYPMTWLGAKALSKITVGNCKECAEKFP